MDVVYDFLRLLIFFLSVLGAGGDDEFQGNVDYTFTRPDGTQLGNQGNAFVNFLNKD